MVPANFSWTDACQKFVKAKKQPKKIRLAAHIGRVDVDQLLDELTPEQFAEWQDYHDVESFGPMFQARALANILAAIAAACGTDMDIDSILRTWGFYIPAPPFDPIANEQAILAGFGG